MTTPKMNEWLQGFDADYQSAAGHDGGEDSYSELPDGEYEVQITGTGWRDYRNNDKEGFSGMGPMWRLRVAKGPHAGKSEEMLWWLIRHNPARGIQSPTLNQDAKRFLERDCARLGITPPDKLSAFPTWTAPRGTCFLLRIKSRTKGDKTHRNLYVQKLLDVDAMRASGFSDYESEALDQNGRWIEVATEATYGASAAYGEGPQGGVGYPY